MRNRIAPVKNVAALQLAYENLAARDQGIPGMGLVYGDTGAGKTTAITKLVNDTNGVYVRAAATWTPATMLSRIMLELGAEPVHRASAMAQYITDALLEQNRPLFVDEADYVRTDKRMLETLRDLHDMTGVPVVLIGMNGIEKGLTAHPQLKRRISQWVRFLPSDVEDARMLTDTVCEVRIEDDLLQLLHAQTKGSTGLMVVALARIEARAKANGWQAVGADQWGHLPFFLGNRPAEA